MALYSELWCRALSIRSDPGAGQGTDDSPHALLCHASSCLSKRGLVKNREGTAADVRHENILWHRIPEVVAEQVRCDFSGAVAWVTSRQ